MRGFAAQEGRAFSRREVETTMYHNVKRRVSDALVVVAGSLVTVGAAMAQTTDPAEQVFTDLGTKATTLAGYGYILLGVVMTGLVGMKLAKKFIGRAS